jgi:hypothetical protein
MRSFPGQTGFSEKLNRLGSEDLNMQRIMAIVRFILPDETESPPFVAIIDTGAIISVFHESWIPLLQLDHLEPHTLFGVVDTPECRLSSQLGRTTISLEDFEGQKRSSYYNHSCFLFLTYYTESNWDEGTSS